MESNKRKRADAGELPAHARVTYYAGPRAFERLFKESSLQELKDVVRRKLGLGSGVVVKLQQMRPNALLDLDDDDDFEALRAQALRDTGSTIDIRVTVEEDQSKVCDKHLQYMHYISYIILLSLGSFNLYPRG
ncbi:hypothetical protein EDD17DRAFT_1518868 [Pisolithus thermaeus]|nr:hypothetical protein EDD17DRAFT_1518868 [Pisolithus thermaeus]